MLNSGPIKDFPDILIEESCLVLYSWFKLGDSMIYYSDSAISVTYNICSYNLDYYKGIINVDGINIAIFDFGNFIDAYYNSDSLQQIPYDNFKCYATNIRFTWTYYIRDGELNFWNP